MVRNFTIKREDVETLLLLIPRSSIITVTFVKKPAKGQTEGEVRVMNCRRGVKSKLTTNPSKPRPTMPPNLVTAYDLQCDGYRQFNLETITEIKAMGFIWRVED